jgi:hypothetical protein
VVFLNNISKRISGQYLHIARVLHALSILPFAINEKSCVRFQVLTAAIMKFRIFWHVVPCSHVEVDRRFRGAYCLNRSTST